MQARGRTVLTPDRTGTALIASLVIVFAAALPVRAAARPAVAVNKAIERNMKAIDKNLRELGGIISDSEKTKDCLKLLLDVQRKLLSVKMQKPSMLADAPKDERDALHREFRLMINKALLEIVEVEIEILEGDHDAASARVRGPLAERIKAGHGKFRIKTRP